MSRDSTLNQLASISSKTPVSVSSWATTIESGRSLSSDGTNSRVDSPVAQRMKAGTVFVGLSGNLYFTVFMVCLGLMDAAWRRPIGKSQAVFNRR